MIAYSLVLKRIPFLEALIVAAGMPLRALAGAALAGVGPSQFLLMCAYLLALFLVAGKRQWEYHNAGERSSAEHRPALAAYRAEGLDYLFIVTGLSTVSAYSAYSVFPTTNLLEPFGITAIEITWSQVFVAMVTIPLLIALSLFVSRTRQGRATAGANR